MVEPDGLRRRFIQRFGSEPRLFFAPGRVNLIGEHTDYNDGFVLPMAIELGTLVAGAVRDDRRVSVSSTYLNKSLTFDLDEPPAPRRGIWLDYVEGVARTLDSRGAELRGADLLIDGDLPVGAGLSSSASLEISAGLALLSLSNRTIDRVELALAGQASEHNYVGIKCGIMDQYIASLGRAGHALLIDCRSLEATPVRMDFPEILVVICDTRVKHKLAASEYNSRQAECERGVELLSGLIKGVRSLRDVSVEDFSACEDQLPEPVRRRCRHVITENARTLAATDALRSGDLAKVGVLMAESHRSLRNDYEVSCSELDLLVELAGSIEGVAGSRMTGGGFGGCTVNLVNRGSLEDFRERVTREYSRTINIEPGIYVSKPAAGAREI